MIFFPLIMSFWMFRLFTLPDKSPAVTTHTDEQLELALEES